MSEDDFFVSSSDEADADDELTDKSTRFVMRLRLQRLRFLGQETIFIFLFSNLRKQSSINNENLKIKCFIRLLSFFYFPREQASSASGKAASGVSSDERNQVYYRVDQITLNIYFCKEGVRFKTVF